MVNPYMPKARFLFGLEVCIGNDGYNFDFGFLKHLLLIDLFIMNMNMNI